MSSYESELKEAIASLTCSFVGEETIANKLRIVTTDNSKIWAGNKRGKIPSELVLTGKKDILFKNFPPFLEINKRMKNSSSG